MAVSFAAICLGWAAAVLAYALAQVHLLGQPYLTDVEAVLYWTALFTFIGWAVFAVPAALRLDGWISALRPGWAVLVGGVCGVAAFLLLAGWLGAWETPLFFGFAAVTGGVGTLAYTLAVRNSRVQAAGQRSGRLPLVVAGLPAVLGLLFALVIWPTIESAAPSVAYRYGGTDAQIRVARRVVRQIKVGDSLAALHRCLPQVFEASTTSMSGNLGAGFSYRITFANGTVTSVAVVEK